jgi:hypothetical protein
MWSQAATGTSEEPYNPGNTVPFRDGRPTPVHVNDDSFRCANSCDGAGEMLPDDPILGSPSIPTTRGNRGATTLEITDGDIAPIDAAQTGSRWISNFDPSRAARPVPDRLNFAFTNCNHGRIDFTSSVAGCGEGHMDATRLTQRRVFVSASQIGSLNHRSTP